MCKAGDPKPVQGLTVTWKGLGLTVKDKACLAPCNGTLRAGSLNALMGPTGAGKTTLLAAIARRGPVTSGDVLYNGEPWSKDLKQRVAFVDQDDVVEGTLSVRETLAYAAAFRMPASSTPAERKARVADVLSMLRLDSCADTVVGNASIVEARGVSGGERKRLCIGTELITEPALLVCDEPTSGLDSAIALVVTKSLRYLAHKRGITVVCSIHQPSSQIFSAFDTLLLLNSSVLVYHGPTSDAADAFVTLRTESGDEAPGVITGWNHADWIMDLLVAKRLDQGALGRAADRALAAGAAGDAEAQPACSAPAAASVRWTPLRSARLGNFSSKGASASKRYTTSWRWQLGVLLHRAMRVARGSGSFWSWETNVLHLGNGLLVGTLFYRLGYEEDDIFRRVAATFFLLIGAMFFPYMASLGFIPSRETLLRKELSSGSYRLSSWFIAETSIGLLPDLVWIPIEVSGVYWLSGVNDDFGVFLCVLCLLVLCVLMFQSLGMLISVLSPKRAPTVALLFLTFMFTFNSLFVPVDQTPLPWACYFNPLYYITIVAMSLTFDASRTYAAPNGSLTYDVPAGTDITKEDILRQFAFTLEPWLATLILVLTVLVFRFATFALLRRKLAAALHVQQVDGPAASTSSSTSTSTSAPATAAVVVEVREEVDMKHAEAV